MQNITTPNIFRNVNRWDWRPVLTAATLKHGANGKCGRKVKCQQEWPVSLVVQTVEYIGECLPAHWEAIQLFCNTLIMLYLNDQNCISFGNGGIIYTLCVVFWIRNNEIVWHWWNRNALQRLMYSSDTFTELLRWKGLLVRSRQSPWQSIQGSYCRYCSRFAIYYRRLQGTYGSEAFSRVNPYFTMPHMLKKNMCLHVMRDATHD